MKTTRERRKDRIHFRPTIFKILGTKDRLTAASGLGTLIELFDRSPLSEEFKRCLPKRSLNRSKGSYRLGLIQLASFIYGHECLDDLEEFEDDPLLEELMRGEVVAPRTMGDFLRDFEPEHIEKLRDFLSSMAGRIREDFRQKLPEVYRPVPGLRIDIDSTPHEQSAEKMEGLAWNYEGLWCLDSQVCFDDMGLSHDVDLRPGNTRSGMGAVEQLSRCFRGTKFTDEKSVSGDSAYCYREVIEHCLRQGILFTFTAHDGVTGWRDRVHEVSEWVEWKTSEKEQKKAEKKKRSPEKIELGRIYWQPSWSESLRIPILIKRTWKEDTQAPLFANIEGMDLGGKWEYYAVLTNFNLYKQSYQEVMEFHHKRARAENFIREEKYGYDLKHFPCQSLRANHAYALLAMIAHNLLRWIAVIERPHKPQFAKKLRRRFIYIPGKVVTHARQTILRIPEKFRKEVQAMREAMTVLRTKPLLVPNTS